MPHGLGDLGGLGGSGLVSEAGIAAAAAPFDAAAWNGCDALQLSCDIDEHFWPDLVSGFGEMGLLESRRLIGKYRQVCILANALRLELEEGAPRFPI